MKLVITGSSSGIGESLAHHLLERGHALWGVSRSAPPDSLSVHPNFRSTRADVSEWSEMERLAAEVSKEWEHLDGLIACAGQQGAIGKATEVNPLHWTQTVRVNLDGTFYSFRALASLLRKAPERPKVIFFSGGGATKARPNFSAYAAAKAGVVRLAENLAEELPELDVNAVAPGAVNTRLTREVLDLGPDVVGEAEYRGALKQMETGGASVDRVSALVDFLLSSESDGISGRLISAPWDPWEALPKYKQTLARSDIFTLRRIVPADRSELFQ